MGHAYGNAGVTGWTASRKEDNKKRKSCHLHMGHILCFMSGCTTCPNI